MTRRTVVITGGTGGIGWAIARRFATEGDAVIVVGRSPAKIHDIAERLSVRWEVCDVSSPKSVTRLTERLPEQIDVVVAMAGGNTDLNQMADPGQLSSLFATAAAWEKNLRVNTIGTVLTVCALHDRLRAGGSVITVSSIGAEYASTSYGAAKAAVAAWTAGISSQLGPKGITANTIAPGYIEGTDFFAGTLSDEHRESLIAATHTKRAGRPEDVAGLAFFLASPDARQITGQVIHINGGAYTTR